LVVVVQLSDLFALNSVKDCWCANSLGENVLALDSNVAGVVLNSSVHHRFAHLVRSAPDRFAHILLELNHVLFALFLVGILLARFASVGTT